MTLIIGHTSGIGKAISNIIEFEGVSKSTGFDINDYHKTKRVFDYSKYNSIVLNAYGDFTSQLKTLYSIVENETFNKETIIVVISSIRAYNFTPDTFERSKYSVEKSAINKASRDLSQMGFNVSVLCPGYVNTEFNKSKDVPKMTPEYIAQITKMIISNYVDNGILMKEIVLEKVK